MFCSDLCSGLRGDGYLEILSRYVYLWFVVWFGCGIGEVRNLGAKCDLFVDWFDGLMIGFVCLYEEGITRRRDLLIHHLPPPLAI